MRPFFEDRAWLEAFGPVLALYQDPLDLEDGLPTSGNVVQFATGLKIDFSLSQVGILQRIVAAPQLPPEFDAGYQVLLDKDHLTAGLKPPTYRAYIPTSPTHAEYDKTVECFFLETTYVAKLLWRDDIIAAKHIADTFLKLEDLIPMLVWRMEMDHNWSYKPGPYGRGLKKWLRPDLWAELESTYAGASIDENWDALWRAIDLMRKVAREVGSLLGYPYPQEIDDRTLSYLRSVKNMLPSATTFPPEILNTPH